MKRFIDITVSGLILIPLAIPLLVITVILKLTGERHAFYLQERVGQYGKIIRITKFATMLKDSPNLGSQDITVRNDPRVLPFGRVLRKTKLNEVPQFWDVFIGKISLVGWRPLMPQGFDEYSDEIKQTIVKVKPGLTGIGSLFFRDEEAIVTSAQADGHELRQVYREDIMPYKGALEVWYVGHQGVATDLKILIATAIAVLRPGWRGFHRWFPGIPTPESQLITRELFGD